MVAFQCNKISRSMQEVGPHHFSSQPTQSPAARCAPGPSCFSGPCSPPELSSLPPQCYGKLTKDHPRSMIMLLEKCGNTIPSSATAPSKY
eukprot:3545584-Amphidinium_carterae.2